MKDNASICSAEMRRHDSGYESVSPAMRYARRGTMSTTGRSGSRARPVPRRSKTAHRLQGPDHEPTAPTAIPARHASPKSQKSQKSQKSRQRPVSCYGYDYDAAGVNPLAVVESASYFPVVPVPEDQVPAIPVLPPTTTYWTSDCTRRREYAAIDAASRGFRGWMLRVVPDCFVPKAKRRVTFDDDSGSVRRYRLDLDKDSSERF